MMTSIFSVKRSKANLLRARNRRVEGTVEEKEVFEEQTVANAMGLSRSVSADLCSHVTSEKSSLSHPNLVYSSGPDSYPALFSS